MTGTLGTYVFLSLLSIGWLLRSLAMSSIRLRLMYTLMESCYGRSPRECLPIQTWRIPIPWWNLLLWKTAGRIWTSWIKIARLSGECWWLDAGTSSLRTVQTSTKSCNAWTIFQSDFIMIVSISMTISLVSFLIIMAYTVNTLENIIISIIQLESQK